MSRLQQALAGNYEILGDDEMRMIAGQDDLDSILSGQDNSGGMEAARAAILARNGLLLKKTAPTKSRRFPLGFASVGTVAATTSATIVSRPQVLFRGERLVVPSDIAGDFTIDDVKVGKDSQFVAEGSIPARALQEDGIDVYFHLGNKPRCDRATHVASCA